MAEDDKPTWTPPSQPPPALGSTFGDTQAIRWARKKFSGPALAVIGLILSGSGGYIVTMEARMRAIEADLREIKHDMPHGDGGLGAVHDELGRVRERLAAIDERLKGQDDALRRIYERFDLDYIDSMAPGSKRKHR